MSGTGKGGRAKAGSGEGSPASNAAAMPRAALGAPSDADTRAYNAAVATARLVAVQLVASDFKVLPRKGHASDGSEDMPPLTVEDGVRVPQFDQERGRSMTVVAWRLASLVSKPPLDVAASASFIVVYDGLKDADPKAVERLVGRIGRFASYPYFRAYVAQVAGMGGLSLPPLPMLRDQVHAKGTLPTGGSKEAPVPAAPERAAKRVRKAAAKRS